MTIPIILACSASAVFGVGYVCGRGMRREEAEYERAMREEMGDLR